MMLLIARMMAEVVDMSGARREKAAAERLSILFFRDDAFGEQFRLPGVRPTILRLAA